MITDLIDVKTTDATCPQVTEVLGDNVEMNVTTTVLEEMGEKTESENVKNMNSSINGDADAKNELESRDLDQISIVPGSEADIPGPDVFTSVYKKDAFLTFRAICKISMKGLHDESGSQYDPIALQNK